MRAIILAAGRGSRMGENTAVLPKCLMRLWGRTLLDWQLKAIREADIEKIGVVTGYHSEEIRRRYPRLTYFQNTKWEETNMVSSLMEAKDWLGEDECIASYADVVYESPAVSSLMAAKSDIALTYYTDFWRLWQERFENPLDDLETFRVDEDSFLTEIGNRASSPDEIMGQYMGLLKFTPKGWEALRRIMGEGLPKPIEKMDMTGLLSYLISRNVKILAIPTGGLWLEVDSPKDLALYSAWPVSRRGEITQVGK